MQIGFEGQRVVVVGAASGIGRATAMAFAEAGAQVWACDILAAEINALANSVESERIKAIAADVTNDVSVQNAINVAQGSADEALDVLVYVAGGLVGTTPQCIEDVSIASWDKVVDVNLRGAFLFCRAAVPAMKKAGRGRIVIVTSTAGLTTTRTGVQSYSAAKHAQVGLVKQLGAELAPHGINVNSVAPGFMPTSPDARRQWNGWSVDAQNAFINGLVGRRLGKPEDISNAILFLASDRAEWITGQTLPVTGAPL